jgi:CheY-like chemotaxis protein
VTGFELCRRIRRQLPDLPVVLVSASFRAQEQHPEWRESGAEAFLEQPIDADHIRKLVHQLTSADRHTSG